MPRVEFDPNLTVTCELSFDGAPSSISFLARTEVGTDFDGDGDMDPGSTIVGESFSSPKRDLGPGVKFIHRVTDVVVFYVHNPDSNATTITATLSQGGTPLKNGTVSRSAPKKDQPGPVLFRFWS